MLFYEELVFVSQILESLGDEKNRKRGISQKLGYICAVKAGGTGIEIVDDIEDNNDRQ